MSEDKEVTAEDEHMRAYVRMMAHLEAYEQCAAEAANTVGATVGATEQHSWTKSAEKHRQAALEWAQILDSLGRYLDREQAKIERIRKQYAPSSGPR